MRTFIALACAATALAAAPARADRTEALLAVLKAKGILSEQEYEALRAEVDAEMDKRAAATASTPEPRPVEAPAERLVRRTETGVGLEIGDITLRFSGAVNGFFVHDWAETPGPTTTVVGGLASVGNDSSSVRNGLLPGFFVLNVSTNQGGWDLGATFGLYPGINSVTNVGGANSPGNPVALATSGIDARQTFLTFGRSDIGTFKLGRDIGLFASEAILNDMTLLGVGTPLGNVAPSNTTLGRIGIGYIYTDFQPQVTYTTPRFAGFEASVGIFQPLSTAGRVEENGAPGFQAKLTYDLVRTEGLTGRFWLSGVSQKHAATAPGGTDSYTGSAFELGGKVGQGPVSVVGSWYRGSGIGTTGLFILPVDELGRKRDSGGFYLQTTATLGKFLFGASYGRSRLDLADGEDNPTLLRLNESWVGQIRYSLTSWLTLVGEYTSTEASAHGGNRAQSEAVALGGILFF